MKIDNQVISLGYAIRLKEMNVPQESLLSWIKKPDGKWVATSYYGCSCWTTNRGDLDGSDHEECAALTASELIEMIPAWIDIGEHYAPFNTFWLEIKKRSAKNIQYIAGYVCDTMDAVEAANPLSQVRTSIKAHDEKLADCLAKLLINLIENDLMRK